MNAPTLIPHMSEKAIALAGRGTYVFEVPVDTNKIEVAKAVEQSFNVKVAAVNMAIHKGKAVQWRARGGKRGTGRRADVKKAMVTLQSGQRIALFEEGK